MVESNWKRPAQVAALLLVLALLTISARATSHPARVTGTLIDLACYAQDKNDTGNHHRGKGMTCAQACAREGFEVGILTTDGKIYHLRGGLTASKNSRLVPYMSQSVVVLGDVSEQNGQSLITSDSLEAAP
jgi:hypothetical protein